MLQKMPAHRFSATTKLEFVPQSPDEKAGLIVFGMDYSSIAIEKSDKGYRIIQTVCVNAEKGLPEEIVASVPVPAAALFFRVTVKPESERENIPKVLCAFSYSIDGKRFTTLGKEFVAREGQWVGAKVGLFAQAASKAKKRGYADFDWFRIRPADR
jgi:beta-xylosidase